MLATTVDMAKRFIEYLLILVLGGMRHVKPKICWHSLLYQCAYGSAMRWMNGFDVPTMLSSDFHYVLAGRILRLIVTCTSTFSKNHLQMRPAQLFFIFCMCSDLMLGLRHHNVDIALWWNRMQDCVRRLRNLTACAFRALAARSTRVRLFASVAEIDLTV